MFGHGHHGGHGGHHGGGYGHFFFDPYYHRRPTYYPYQYPQGYTPPPPYNPAYTPPQLMPSAPPMPSQNGMFSQTEYQKQQRADNTQAQMSGYTSSNQPQ